MAGKPQPKPRVLKPGLLVLACAMLWAAAHQPAAFDLGSVSGWALGMVTVALLARAALALAGPLLKILGDFLASAMRDIQKGGEP